VSGVNGSITAGHVASFQSATEVKDSGIVASAVVTESGPFTVNGMLYGATTSTAASTAAGATGNLFATTGGAPAPLSLNYSALTDGATITWAIGSAPLANASVTLGGNRTLNVSGLVNGGHYNLAVTQDATGSRGLTLGTGCTWKVINQGDASTITLSTTAGRTDNLIFSYDGTNCQVNAVLSVAGSASVTSVGQTVNSGSTSGIFTVTGSPVTTSGTLNINLSGTSGGIPYFSSSTVLSSSAALAANQPVVGGGAGTAPATISLTYATLTDGATITWAIGSGAYQNAKVTLGGNRTLNITGPLNGGQYTLEIVQDATGSRTLALGTGCTWKVIGGGAGAITLSTAANAIDVLSFTYDGTNCLATLGKNFN